MLAASPIEEDAEEWAIVVHIRGMALERWR